MCADYNVSQHRPIQFNQQQVDQLKFIFPTRYKERVGSIRRELQGAKSMAEDYRVGDGHVTDLRCVIVNMKYFFFESKKNLLKLLNRFCEKHFYCACGICIDQGHKQRQKLLTKYFEVAKLRNDISILSPIPLLSSHLLQFFFLRLYKFRLLTSLVRFVRLFASSAMLYQTLKLIG